MEVEVIIDELPRDTAVEHRTKEKIPLPPDKKFHIFFSYTDVPRDKLWVKSVIDKLEREYGYTCCDHERDFLPGTKVMDNIKYGLMNSEKVVVVFSKEAIDSHYVSLEAEMAFKQSLDTRQNLLIPVLLDDCDVPEEYKLLTYIDAREGVEETTWWPKLLKSLESANETSRPQFHVKKNSVAVDRTFAVYKLCTMETKCNYLQRSMQADSKNVPAEMRLEALGVPADIIRRAYKELLQSPRVLCRQKCWIVANIWKFFVVLGYFVPLGIFLDSIISCMDSPPCTIDVGSYFWIGFFILVPVCVFFGCKKYYLKNPSSVHENLIEHNKTLAKYGVMVTVVNTRMWYRASEYVFRHLAKEESTDTTEHTDIPHIHQTVDPNNDLPLLSGIVEPNQRREKSVQSVDTINQVMPEEIEDVADDEPLLPIQKTENLDYENKALDMLLSCTPEYLTLVYSNKLKIPKVNRHGIKVLCLCQYLEEVDKDFRKKVQRMESLRRKSNIEENDENNTNLENI